MSSTDHTGDRDDTRQEEFRAGWLEAPPQINGPIVLAEYNPEWPAQYEREATEVVGQILARSRGEPLRDG
jgi:hypothetical protein